MNRGPWRATVHGVTKNQTQLSTHVIRVERVISHKETKKLQLVFFFFFLKPFGPHFMGLSSICWFPVGHFDKKNGARPGVTAWWSGSCSQATTAPTLVTINCLSSQEAGDWTPEF